MLMMNVMLLICVMRKVLMVVVRVVSRSFLWFIRR